MATASPTRRRPQSAGDRLKADVLARFDLEPAELLSLDHVARLATILEGLDAIIERDGLTITGPDGCPRVHPAVIEARQSRIALARLLAALRLPELEAQGRPQRRATRGVYELGASA